MSVLCFAPMRAEVRPAARVRDNPVPTAEHHQCGRVDVWCGLFGVAGKPVVGLGETVGHLAEREWVAVDVVAPLRRVGVERAALDWDFQVPRLHSLSNRNPQRHPLHDVRLEVRIEPRCNQRQSAQ